MTIKIPIKELINAVLILDENGKLTDIQGEVVDEGNEIEREVILQRYGGENFIGEVYSQIALKK